MGEYLDRLPQSVQEHIRLITGISGLPRSLDAADLMARGWLERREKFERTMRRMQMEEIGTLPRDDARGCLALTVSGSLLSISPLRDNLRTAQYTSIKLRGNVPGIATSITARLAGDVSVGEPIAFERGPIRSSSAVYKIAVTTEDLDLEAQMTLITEATRALTKELIEGMREWEADGG